MSEQTPQTPAQPKVTPLSMAAFGPLTALVVRKEFIHDGKPTSDIFISVRRNVQSAEDDPNLIPLIEVPALLMLLKNVAEPAMSVRSYTAPANPMVPKPGEEPMPPTPAPPNRQQRRAEQKKGGKKR